MEKIYNINDFKNYLIAVFRCAVKMDDCNGEYFIEDQMKLLFEGNGMFECGKSCDFIVLNFDYDLSSIVLFFKFCCFLEEKNVENLFNIYCDIVLDENDIIEEA